MTDKDSLPSLEDAIALLKGVSTATLTTQLLKRGIPSTYMSGVMPLCQGEGRFAGEAATLRLLPSREDLMDPDIVKNPDYPQRKVIEDCPAGQVLVVDARGVSDVGVFGDILITRLQVRGVAAVVTDGGMRDGETIAEMGLPVYCGGIAAPSNLVAHYAPDKGLPVCCGGVTVIPGDIIVGDGDGVVVLPRALAPELARDGAEQERLEVFIQKKVREGAPTPGTYPPNEATLAEYRDWDGEA
jgi:regulator of RNase E activity RraA